MRRSIRALALLTVAGAIAVAAGAAGRQAHGGHTAPAPALISCPGAVRGLGQIAFVAEGRLELIDLGSCRLRELATRAAGDVRFSPDGRWVAYSRAAGASSAPLVVPVGGGSTSSPLGSRILAWRWAGAGDALYGLNFRGQLLSGTPGHRPRIVASGVEVPQASSPAIVPSPNGRRLAVNRSRCTGPPETELDTFDPASATRRVVLTRGSGQAVLAGWSPDGRWLLYWAAAQCSASLAADGFALKAVPAAAGHSPRTAVTHMLLYPDYLTWCANRLIAAATPTRETQLGSTLVETGPPSWRQRTIRSGAHLSWVSPACAPSGTLLTATAGPDTQNSGFGIEHRSIWLLRPDGTLVRQLTTPPSADLTDEAPRFSHDGRWILFVRTHVVTVGNSAVSESALELVPVAVTGTATPVAIAQFTSTDFSYYDHFNWPTEIDWTAAD